MLMKKVLASSLLVVMAIAAAYWVATPSFGRVVAAQQTETAQISYTCRFFFEGGGTTTLELNTLLTEHYTGGLYQVVRSHPPTVVEADCIAAANAEQAALEAHGWTTGPVFIGPASVSFQAIKADSHSSMISSIHDAGARVFTTSVPLELSESTEGCLRLGKVSQRCGHVVGP